jgi:hypothetical protein
MITIVNNLITLITLNKRMNCENTPECVESSEIVKRVRSEYNLFNQTSIEIDKEEIMIQFKKLKHAGKSVIFENQELIASQVVTGFKNRKIINIMVISKTQSGKTGSMCATIKQYLEDTSNLIPIKNIYIITGLSSCEWKVQTKERMPDSITVYHRVDLLTKFVEDIKGKKNILIIMDEIQVAAKKDQTIYKVFEKAGLFNKSSLYENDVKILEYTATPDGTIYDLMKWNESSEKILAEVGDKYVSSFNLLEMGRVKQYKCLYGFDKDTNTVDTHVFDNIREIKADIDIYNEPRYHIIRTKTGIGQQDITMRNFEEIFDNETYEFRKYDIENNATDNVTDINEILKMQPIKHTIIFIKEMLRCAKTLHKTHIGILYDRYCKTPDDSAIIQGLIGRDTGYDNNGKSICYTNIDSIVRYEKLWNSKFETENNPDSESIFWNSKTTKYVNGNLTGVNTFNDPINFTKTRAQNIEDIITKKQEQIIKREEQLRKREKKISEQIIKREEQLRKREEKIRKKEEQIREKEEQIRDKSRSVIIIHLPDGYKHSKKEFKKIYMDADYTDDYTDYKLYAWTVNNNTDEYSKWGIKTLLKDDAMSAKVNIGSVNTNKNVLMVYHYNGPENGPNNDGREINVLIVSPWNGCKKDCENVIFYEDCESA